MHWWHKTVRFTKTRKYWSQNTCCLICQPKLHLAHLYYFLVDSIESNWEVHFILTTFFFLSFFLSFSLFFFFFFFFFFLFFLFFFVFFFFSVCFFLFFLPFRATPAACGSSQVRDWIWAAAASLPHSHSYSQHQIRAMFASHIVVYGNAKSLTH